jgi:predicted alpha-1,2-mannosidase
MKKLSFWIVALMIAMTANSQTINVDPFIGSGGHGHVFVGANVPFGAVQVGPSNFYKGWDWCSGYNWQDSVIIGFPQLHLSGTGIGDLGDILIMPYMGDVKLDKGKETVRYSGFASQFSHNSEVVQPGYYKVRLDDYGIEVELTASERVGYHKYRFPTDSNVPARIIIDLTDGINDKSTDTYIELADQYTIKGYRSSSGWAKKQQVFFAIKSSLPIKDFAIYEKGLLIKGKKAKSDALKGLLTFAKAPQEISLKVGISPVSADNALANIKAEIPGWDFEKIRVRALEKWDNELSKITVETADTVAKRIFYTSMYHAMIHPSLFDDANSKNANRNYTIFSLWDTYRAAHSLYTLTNPDRVGDFVNSMLDIFDKTGALPIWHLNGYETGTMVGISSFQVIAEAYLKGCKGFDPQRAFNAMKTTAMSDLHGMEYDRAFKPIPSDKMKKHPVASALEYAIGTGAIALMAKSLGKTEDYEYFKKRSENYKLYYDDETGFFRGKMSDGRWNPVFDPLKSIRPYATDYAEGNAWQYLWLVPQDIYGLIDLLGGKTAFLDRLDQFFSLSNDPNDPNVLIDLTGLIGQYAHGNEPSHHIAYMYAYAGQQWKTARLTRQIMTEFYTDRPDGIIGNEDCGQMSAWYVFSALGFYPVMTASGEYVIGSPLFDKATINLDNGKKFTVEAVNNSAENVYIQSVELNGKPYPFTYITHNDIVNGGTLKIVMGKKPNYEYGTLQEKNTVLASPDGALTITFGIKAEKPVYEVHYKNKLLIESSALGLELEQNVVLGNNTVIEDVVFADGRDEYSLVTGRTSVVSEAYKSVTIAFSERDGLHRRMSVEARAYNDAVAFRYHLPEQEGLSEYRLKRERTEFRLSKDAFCYALVLPNFRSGYESEYHKVPASGLANQGGVASRYLLGLPLVVDIADAGWIAITETHLENNAAMYLCNTAGSWTGHRFDAVISPNPTDSGAVITGKLPHQTAWRVIMAAADPARFIESNVITNLNPDCRIRDMSWIKAGKSAWDWWNGSLNRDGKTAYTTETMKYYVDFAAESGLEFMTIDAGWCGNDITKCRDNVNVPEVVAYARSKGVKVFIWLYAHYVWHQMDKAFPLYEQWGVAGMKIDFVERDDQAAIDFYYKVAEKAAKHRLMVDFHGATKPWGLQRTYPNVVGYEGIIGMEQSKAGFRDNPENRLVIPFTRMIPGLVDYTPGGFDNVTREDFTARMDGRPSVMGTRAHHLAMYVVYESPYQMVSDWPEAYRGDPSFRFVKDVPAASWDATRVLNGYPGEYITIVRRKGNEWYLGAMTNFTSRSYEISLDFLGSGVWTAEVYADAPDSDRQPKNIIIRKEKVKANGKMKIRLASAGGLAVRFRRL